MYSINWEKPTIQHKILAEMINLWGHKLKTATEENLRPQMPNPWLINCLKHSLAPIHYQIIIAFINWKSLPSNLSAVSYEGHVFKMSPFLEDACFWMVTRLQRVTIQLQQVSWLIQHHSFLLLTRWPVKHCIRFLLSHPTGRVSHEINWRKIWQWYFILGLFYWMSYCSPWLFILQMEMNTSH